MPHSQYAFMVIAVVSNGGKLQALAAARRIRRQEHLEQHLEQHLQRAGKSLIIIEQAFETHRTVKTAADGSHVVGDQVQQHSGLQPGSVGSEDLTPPVFRTVGRLSTNSTMLKRGGRGSSVPVFVIRRITPNLFFVCIMHTLYDIVTPTSPKDAHSRPQQS
eukprot:1050358-Pelagomonas_calceolata.AAC.1